MHQQIDVMEECAEGRQIARIARQADDMAGGQIGDAVAYVGRGMVAVQHINVETGNIHRVAAAYLNDAGHHGFVTTRAKKKRLPLRQAL